METNVHEDRSAIQVEETIFKMEYIELENKADQQKYLNHFGYLADLPGHSLIPQNCLRCSKVINCVLNSEKISTFKKDK